jgi:lysozyme
MKTSADGIALMHHYETCKLEAYPDPATGGDPWTIGWGDTGHDVVPGLVITQEDADRRFAERLAREFEPGVSKLAITATQKQYDAMVSLAYNIGLKNFRTSTVLNKTNEGEKEAAANAFMLWNRAAGKVMKGLQRRRYAERMVYLGADAQSAISAAERQYP